MKNGKPPSSTRSASITAAWNRRTRLKKPTLSDLTYSKTDEAIDEEFATLKPTLGYD